MSISESKKTKKPCKILSQECIGTDIYSMWLDAGEIGKNDRWEMVFRWMQ